MKIVLNGVEEQISQKTIADLLKAKGLVPERVVVEVNLQIIGKDEYPSYILKENDHVEILRFVGGG